MSVTRGDPERGRSRLRAGQRHLRRRRAKARAQMNGGHVRGLCAAPAPADEEKMLPGPEWLVARVQASDVLEATRLQQRDQLAIGVHAAREPLGFQDTGLRRNVDLFDVHPAALVIERLALQEVRLAGLPPEWPGSLGESRQVALRDRSRSPSRARRPGAKTRARNEGTRRCRRRRRNSQNCARRTPPRRRGRRGHRSACHRSGSRPGRCGREPSPSRGRSRPPRDPDPSRCDRAPRARSRYGRAHRGRRGSRCAGEGPAPSRSAQRRSARARPWSAGRSRWRRRRNRSSTSRPAPSPCGDGSQDGTEGQEGFGDVALQFVRETRVGRPCSGSAAVESSARGSRSRTRVLPGAEVSSTSAPSPRRRRRT